MSLITRCPACATRFRVVRDQLKISEGWVRCGQCGEVFDAQADLQESADPASDPAADLAPEPVLATEPDLQWTAPMEPQVPAVAAQAPPATPLEAQPLPRPARQPETESPAREPGPAPRGEPALATGPIEPVLDAYADEAPDTVPPTPARPVVPPQAARAARPPAHGADDDLEDVSFVRQARRRAFWQRPLVKVALVLTSFLLGAVLALQVVLQHHDLLAAQAPGLRPVLEAACRPLGCSVGPPRRIEAIVIDNSSFSRLRADAFRLSVNLANQSRTVVAMPALELTMTDAQDQPVLRRVISPAELGQGASLVIAANAEWAATLTVAVAPNAGAGRIAGYRLLAFYP